MATVLKSIVELVGASFKEWNEDRASRLSAALAYYTVFSISPLLIIALAIAGQFFDQNAARDQLILQIAALIGQSGADMVKTMLESASRPSDSLVASTVSLVLLLFGASGVFSELQGALNTIWEVAPKPGRGLWATIQTRFLSFAMVLGVGFLLLVSLVVSTVLSVVNNSLANLGQPGPFLLQFANFMISLAAVTLIFALIFKFVPDVRLAWGDVWLGSIVTALLFTIGKFAIGLYLGSSAVVSAYGAAGSLVLILLWVYYSTQILFFGAEFIQVYADRYGTRPRPTRGAIALTEKSRVQEGMPHDEEVHEQRKKSRQPKP